MCTGTRLSCAGAPCPHFFPGGRGTQPPGLVTTTLVPSIHSGCTGSPLHRPNTCQERGDRDVCNFSVCDLSSARQPAPQVRGWGTPSESQPWTADVTVLARVRQQGASENPDDLGGPPASPWQATHRRRFLPQKQAKEPGSACKTPACSILESEQPRGKQPKMKLQKDSKGQDQSLL